MHRDNVTLLDIADAARLIRQFTVDMDRETFFADPKSKSATLYQLLVIGEAVKRSSREFRMRNLSIPWTLMAGMRDHLIHAYDAVDWNEVWITSTRDIPTLLTQIEPLLPKENDE
jgi:uncharacterized protein with HEPN domain